MRIHNNTKYSKMKNFSCSNCDYKSYTKQNSKSHQKSNHKGKKVEMIIAIGVII